MQFKVLLLGDCDVKPIDHQVFTLNTRLFRMFDGVLICCNDITEA
jgi:hypothetical protein